jgi:hypothetical protein
LTRLVEQRLQVANTKTSPGYAHNRQTTFWVD